MRKIPRDMISFVVLLGLGLGGTWYVHGSDRVLEALGDSAILILEITPLIVAALFIGGYFQALVPRERVARMLGDGSGFKGLFLASAAGALTPGGPFASFPLVVALFRAGAGYGAAVAYLTAWTGIAVQRAIVWEWPLLGTELAVARYIVSIPLPIIAGLVARRLAARFLPPAGTDRLPGEDRVNVPSLGKEGE